MVATRFGSFAAGKRLGIVLDLCIWLGLIVLLGFATRLLAHAGVSTVVLQPLGAPILMLVLFAWATVSLHRHGEDWRSIVLRRRVSIGRTIGLVVAGYFGGLVLNALLFLLVAPRLGIARPSLSAFAPLVHHPLVYAVWLALAWTSAALGEELQFRGFLMSRFERLFGGGRWALALALVGQAVCFGACHIYQGMGGVLATAVLGLVLGAVFLAARRNIVPNVLVHGLIDTGSLTLIFLGYGATAAS
jgi:membrane protease YdiL (CAAX protease family)